jgi:hypothetical protein
MMRGLVDWKISGETTYQSAPHHIKKGLHLNIPCYYSLKYLLFPPSPRRYNSGWALAFWTICLHSPLFRGCLVSEQLIFMVWGYFPHAQPPTWRTRVFLFVWLLPHDLSGMGAPTSSYATTGIALRVSGTLKPYHHDKVKTPSVGIFVIIFF